MKRFSMVAAAIVLALALGGCGLFSKDKGDTGKVTPATAVYSVHAAYNAALVAAVTYTRLPRCAKTTSKICSKQSIVDSARRADNIANAALEIAQQVVRDNSTDQAARDRARSKAFEAIGAFKYVLTSNGISIKESQ